MHVIKSFLIALSMYSIIPTIRTEWKEEDMKYVFVFFPFVGVIIGALVFGWNILCRQFEIGEIARTIGIPVIAILLSGGIHVDGFMDTSDAFCSYREKEKKLEILKDPHIGAFAVISLAVCILIYLAAISQIQDKNLMLLVCISFAFSRVLSALAAVFFPSAKSGGTLAYFATNASKITVRILLFIEAAICIGAEILIHPLYGGILTLISGLVFLFYYLKCKKELGGITGDTEGFFVVVYECAMAVTAAVINIVAGVL